MWNIIRQLHYYFTEIFKIKLYIIYIDILKDISPEDLPKNSQNKAVDLTRAN